jgi:ribosomal 30S subunit maturation factor RimM
VSSDDDQRRRIAVTEFVSIVGTHGIEGFEVCVRGMADEPERLDVYVQPMLGQRPHEWNEQNFARFAEAAAAALARGRSLRERVCMCLQREPIS